MTEAQTINFELVSPEERLVSEPVKMAVIPASEGEMGVGAGHASFVVSLKPGLVKLIVKDGDEPRSIFIAGGFADITDEACVVLAEDAVNADELDQGAVEQEIRDLNEDLGLAIESFDKARIQKKIRLAKAKLSAVTGTLVL